MSAMHIDMRFPLSADINDIEANSLALTVTICPNDQVVYVPAVLAEVLDHLLGVFNWHFLQWNFV